MWFGLDPDGRDSCFAGPRVLSPSSPASSRRPLRVIGDDARIGEREKDGVVFNRYVRAEGSLRPDLAWHTDALRDVFSTAGALADAQIGLHSTDPHPRGPLLPGRTPRAWARRC